MIARFKSRTLAPSVWQPTALKPVVPVLRDRCFECVHVYIVIAVSKCVCHLHNKELLYFTFYCIDEMTQNNGIRPFKVIQGHHAFGTNGRPMYDFVLSG